GRARPAENIVVQKNPHGVDAHTAQLVQIGGARRDVPRAIALGAELKLRAFAQVGVAGVNVVDASDLEGFFSHKQSRVGRGDWRQLCRPSRRCGATPEAGQDEEKKNASMDATPSGMPLQAGVLLGS